MAMLVAKIEKESYNLLSRNAALISDQQLIRLKK
jgi:hypothetical protein